MTTTEKQYGWHIDRGGAVHRLRRPARHGRAHLASAYLIGYVWRERRGWRNDQCCDHFPTQRAAAESLDRIVPGGDQR
jgi:hypothetical protein